MHDLPPIYAIPFEVLQRILRFAIRQSSRRPPFRLRYVNRAFDEAVFPLLFSSFRYPYQASREQALLSFLRQNEHVAGAIQHVRIFYIADMTICSEFLSLCRADKPLLSIHWGAKLHSMPIIEGTNPSALARMRNVYIVTDIIDIATVIWIVLNASQLEQLVLRAVEFNHRPNPVPPPRVDTGPSTVLKYLSCHCTTEDSAARPFMESTISSAVEVFCRVLTVLDVTVIPMELSVVQRILDTSKYTLTTLSVMIQRAGDLDDSVHPCLKLDDLLDLRTISFGINRSLCRYLARSLLTAKRLTAVSEVEINLRGATASTEGVTALKDGLDALGRNKKMQLAVFTPGMEYRYDFAWEGVTIAGHARDNIKIVMRDPMSKLL